MAGMVNGAWFKYFLWISINIFLSTWTWILIFWNINTKLHYCTPAQFVAAITVSVRLPRGRWGRSWGHTRPRLCPLCPRCWRPWLCTTQDRGNQASINTAPVTSLLLTHNKLKSSKTHHFRRCKCPNLQDTGSHVHTVQFSHTGPGGWCQPWPRATVGPLASFILPQ